MSMRVDDVKLSKAPLVEALLEVHFNKTADYLAYGPIPGQIYERLRTVYPNATDLDAANLPLNIEAPSPFVRHRFSTADGARLFQVGNGIVTVNTVGYDTYEVFRTQVEPVIAEAANLFGLPTQAVLRYINKIPTGGLPTESVLRLGVNVPDSSGIAWTKQQASCARVVRGLGEFQMSMATPVDHRADLILFDLQVTSEAMGESDGDIVRWMDGAHAEIERVFLGNLLPDFLETLK